MRSTLTKVEKTRLAARQLKPGDGKGGYIIIFFLQAAGKPAHACGICYAL